MLLNTGTQDRLISESTTSAGTTRKQGSTKSDSILITVFVSSVTSGTLDVSVVTLTEEGKEAEVIRFPTISTTTTELLLRKSAITMQRFEVRAEYSGICDYEVYARAIQGAGESSAKISGASQFRVSQTNVTTTPSVLIAAALTDRSGLIIKNWSGSSTMYLAETLVKATEAEGYPLGPKDALALDISAGVEVYAVADTGTVDVRMGEA